MSKKLWEASEIVKNKSNLLKFEKFLAKKYTYKITRNYSKILNWSINNPKKFWSSIWDFAKVKGKRTNNFKFSKNFINNKFLINSKLNFAELIKKK